MHMRFKLWIGMRKYLSLIVLSDRREKEMFESILLNGEAILTVSIVGSLMQTSENYRLLTTKTFKLLFFIMFMTRSWLETHFPSFYQATATQ